MPERVRKCPSCGGNLVAGRFDRDTRCTFCNSQVLLDPAAVYAEDFRDAFADWDDPATWGAREWCTVAGTSWLVGERIATGDASEVYRAARGRFPTERALIRVARYPADAARLERAWTVGRRLQASKSRGAALATRLPEPIAFGEPLAGAWKGKKVLVQRWSHNHERTLEQVSGVSPQASVWVLRRILEALSFIHGANLVHGAIVPAHVLVERGEHGARLVGLGSAGESGAEITFFPSKYRHVVPDDTLSVAGDLRAAARTIVHVLGGDATSGRVAAAPAYADLLRALVHDGATPQGDTDAWSVRDRVGAVAQAAFGRPTFCPILPR